MARGLPTTLLAFLLLFAAGATESIAQRDAHHRRGAAGPGESAEQHVSVLDARLDLTDDQKERLLAIFEAHEAEMGSWRDGNETATPDEREAHHRRAMESLTERVRTVLTPEQAEQLDMVHEQMHRGEARHSDHEGMHEGRRHLREEGRGSRMRGERMRRDGSPGEGMRGRALGMRLINELDLTDLQKEQVKHLHEAHRAAMQQWRDQNPDATAEERRAWMQESAEQHHVALQQILTDEQRRQFEKLRSDRMQERVPREDSRP